MSDFVGTENNDSLVGTTGDDQISGAGGVDTLNGLDGNDTVNGGAGADLLTGGPGNDVLHGDEGDDLIFAGGGNDIIDGGAGYDRAAFQGGAPVTIDLAIVGAQATGQGSKTFAGIEHLSGTVGNDTLVGDGQANFLWGFSGGNDSLNGRDGDDLLVISAGSHTVDGGAGVDSLLASYSLSGGVNFALYAQGGPWAFNQGTVLATNIENLSGTVFSDNLQGDGGANVLAGNKGDDNLFGNGGDDVLLGDGEITLVNGVGTTLSAPSAGAPAGAADGDDYLAGGAGNDTIDGGEGYDRAAFYTPETLPGSFRLVEGTGPEAGKLIVERVDGATVEAVFRIQLTPNGAIVTGLNSAADQGTDIVTNVDELHFLPANTPFDPARFLLVQVGLSGFIDDANHFAHAAGTVRDDLIDLQALVPQATNAWNLNADGGALGADTIIGHDGNNWVRGNAGDDSLSGRGGDDYQQGDAGNDVIDGGAGRDTVGYELPAGTTGTLQVAAGSGDDAGKQLVQLVNGASVETIFAITQTSPGAFSVEGRGSAASFGVDTVTNTEALNVTVANPNGPPPASAWVNLTPNAWTDAANHNAGVDGTAFGDIIDMAVYHLDKDGTWSRFLNGYGGDDTLQGRDFDENLNGGDGNDMIRGGNGRDVASFELPAGMVGSVRAVTGPAPNTVLIQRVDGPVVENLFLVSQDANGASIVQGLNSAASRGTDTVHGTEGLSFYLAGTPIGVFLQTTFNTSSWTDQNGPGVHTSGSAFDDVMNLQALTPQADATWRLNADGGAFGADTIIGHAGANWLRGNNGDDSLSGGAGNDDLMGDAGNDTLDGGADRDTINVELPAGTTGSLRMVVGSGADAGKVIIQRVDGALVEDVLAITRTGPTSFTTEGRGSGAFLGTDTITNAEGLNVYVLNPNGPPPASQFVNLTPTAWVFEPNHNVGVDGSDFDDNINLADVHQDKDATWARFVNADFGNDLVTGTTLNEGLNGGAGDDTLLGLGGSDNLSGDAGNDLLDGGDAVDTASYGSAGAGVSVSLAVTIGQAVGGGQGVDTLVNIENLTGSAFGDQLTGNALNNFLGGNGGDDTLSGLDGNDNVQGGQGNDRLDGGAGFDTANYAQANGGVTVDLRITGGQAVGADQGVDTLVSIENVMGSNFDDLLIGDATGNFNNGGNGNDTMQGREGADNLQGNAGNDVLFGGQDNDTLVGGAGNDQLFGDLGSDQLVAGAGNDTIDGGDGVDIAIFSDATSGVAVSLAIVGAQTVGGGLGVDTLLNVEQLFGSNFNDTLAGGANGDLLVGSAGADSLSGAAGDDILVGGAGDDTFDGGSNTSVTGQRGAVGGDFVSYNEAGFTTGVTVDLAIATAQAVGAGRGLDVIANVENLLGSNLNDTLAGDGGSNYFGSLGGDDQLFGRGGDDVLEGGAGNDTLDGGAGFDYAIYDLATTGVTVDLAATGAQAIGGGQGVDVLAGIEAVLGSDFADTLSGNADVNQLDGGAGNDVMRGAGGADTLLGAAGDDSLQGGDADDVLSGEAGNDVLDGGVGNDTARFAGARADYQVEFLSGGLVKVTDLRAGSPDGADTLTGVEQLSFSDVTIPAGGQTGAGGTGDDVFNGTEGDDTYNGQDGDDFINGAGGNDSLVGGGGIDIVNGGAGADTLAGFDGDDQLRGNAGDDSLIGGNGNDLLRGNAGVDSYDGGAGQDRVSFYDLTATHGVIADLATGIISDDGFGNVETMVSIEGLGGGTRFVDQLSGDNGDNVIVGGWQDILAGRGGNDLFQVGGAAATVDGGSGIDTLQFSQSRTIDANNDGVGDEQETTNGVWVDLAQQRVVDDGFGQTGVVLGIENVYATQYADTLVGDGLDNLLIGFEGADSLVGGDGADTLEGDAGNDRLVGGAGADRALFEGTRAQYLVEALSDGTVRVTDLRAGSPDGVDILSGVESLAFSDQTIAAPVLSPVITGTEAADTLNGTAGADTIVGLGGNDNLDGQAGDDSINGGAGLDFLRGQDGADTLSGGDGDDFLSGGAGNDRLDGGAGLDRVSYASAASGVNVNLSLTSAQNTGLGLDTLLNIEHLSGTNAADTLIGNAGANWLWGLTGSDSINGQAGDDQIWIGPGNSTVSGGAGIDTLSFSGNGTAFSTGVSVTLATTGPQVSGAGTLTLSGLENLSGSGFADTLTGDGMANVLTGAAGDDRLTGGAGADTLSGDGFFGVDTGGLGGSGSLGSELNPTAEDAPQGSDSLNGGDGDDRLIGGGGFDRLDGGAGTDTAVFRGARAGYSVVKTDTGYIVIDTNLTDGNDGADTLVGVERLQFSDLAVSLGQTVGFTTTTLARAEGASGSTAFSYTVTRSGDTTAALDVPYTVRGSGVDPADAGDIVGFNGVSMNGSVHFNAGQTTATVTIQVAGDRTRENNEGFSVTLGRPATGDVTLVNQIATGTIQNDDLATPVLLPQPFPVGFWTFADPHLTTLDGLQYDMQAAGEFTLVESSRGVSLSVQARTEAINDYASEITAIAAKVGSAKVMIDAATDTVRVNGAAITLPASGVQQIAGGGSVSAYVQDGASGWVISFPDGGKSALIVLDRGDHLDVSFVADPSRAGDFRGLLGNYNGSTADDLVSRGGTPLAATPTQDQFFTFVDSWRITQAESLFTYASGQGTANFQNLAFRPGLVSITDFPAELVAAANAAADAAGLASGAVRDAAIRDFLMTGDATYLDSAVSAGASQPNPQAVTLTGPADTAVKIGVGSVAPVQAEGSADGTSYAFTIYRSSGDGALTVNWAVAGAAFGAVTAANAADFGGVLPAGAVTFADGETSVTVVVTVAGDVVFENDEGFVFSITGPAGTRVIAGSTQVTIVNDDAPPPAPGTNAADVMQGTDGADTMDGGNGADTLQGEAGADKLEGGNDNDRIFGGAGADTIGGGNGADTLEGGSGADQITGDNGDDRLDGGVDDDKLIGGNGVDTLIGGAGDDTLTGDNGADVFVFGAGFGHDRILDFDNADVIRFADGVFSSFAQVKSHALQSGGNVVITDDAGDSITLVGVKLSDLTAGDFTFG